MKYLNGLVIRETVFHEYRFLNTFCYRIFSVSDPPFGYPDRNEVIQNRGRNRSQRDKHVKIYVKAYAGLLSATDFGNRKPQRDRGRRAISEISLPRATLGFRNNRA